MHTHTHNCHLLSMSQRASKSARDAADAQWPNCQAHWPRVTSSHQTDGRTDEQASERAANLQQATAFVHLHVSLLTFGSLARRRLARRWPHQAEAGRASAPSAGRLSGPSPDGGQLGGALPSTSSWNAPHPRGAENLFANREESRTSFESFFMQICLPLSLSLLAHSKPAGRQCQISIFSWTFPLLSLSLSPFRREQSCPAARLFGLRLVARTRALAQSAWAQLRRK